MSGAAYTRGVVLAVLAAAGAAAFALLPPKAVSPMPALGSEATCATYSGLPPGWGKDLHSGMVRLTGERFTLGGENGYAEELPLREVQVDAFWIDRTEVTNAQFAAFVDATGYRTVAERVGSGVVFRAPVNGESAAFGSWWKVVRGADWRHPDGPESSLKKRENHPVAQVTRADAQAYAAWLGRTLPTEAQWEYAAKADGRAERIDRGPRDAQGRPRANFWQGIFPYLDSAEDGHIGRAPVGCYEANGFGLQDLIGNVWEWTSDPWSEGHQQHGTGMATAAGGRAELGLIKGGSFLCSTDFCVRYRASARHPQELDVPASHIGFRTVVAR